MNTRLDATRPLRQPPPSASAHLRYYDGRAALGGGQGGARRRIPKTMNDAARELGKARGTLTPARLGWLVLRSKLDRLLARR